MRSRTTIFAGGAALTAAALSLTLVAPATADIAPRKTDIIGVGSDTVQNIANFMADGDPSLASVGINAAGGKNRFFSFDATPDANDRAGYLNNSTSLAPKPLNPTIVFRAGNKPVQRPNGSSSGVKALLADTTATSKINFVRMSRLPSAAEHDKATANGWVGGLRVIKLSTDAMKIAATDTTNAPAAIAIADLVKIYKCEAGARDWTAFGGSAGTIIPQMPQVGSGTGDSFKKDLKTANGGVDVPLGACVEIVEENDPNSITGSSSPANTIAPFSEGRDNLYNSGYFTDPTVPFPGSATPLNAGIKMLGGYVQNRGLYIVFRDRDKDSTVPFQPGGNLNWVRSLFYNPGGTAPYAAGADAAGAITAGGATPAYTDCGAGNTVVSC